ncbi:MAG: hypothetical protein SWX82_18960 [Cyanobacteriota bacterium]|nr:hypothetical protein [Cyanobacteriota bacterium]
MNPTEALPELKIGQLHLWHPDIIEILKRSKGWHPEANFYDLIGMKPDLWAAHSVGPVGHVLPMLSFTSINSRGNETKTAVVALPYPSSFVLTESQRIAYSQDIKEAVHQEIEETSKIMLYSPKARPFSQDFNSTFLVLEILRLQKRNELKED